MLDGRWVDFWGSDSEAAEAAYQDGANSYYSFRSSYSDTITLVFMNKGGLQRVAAPTLQPGRVQARARGRQCARLPNVALPIRGRTRKRC